MSITEDELPKFEITKDNALSVARPHSIRYLSEQPPSLRFFQPFPLPNIRMEITGAGRKHKIGGLVPEEDFVEGIDMGVRVETVVSGQEGARRFPAHYLKQERELGVLDV